jgi:uncharacterized protein YutE (UPF0331/DUF86 family)
MVDKPKLDQMLSNLRGYLQVLKELAAVPKQAFLSNRDKIGNAKYHFVIAIECCIDVANHIIASEGYRIPKDNADSLVVLIEEGVLSSSKEESYRAMAAFRNRLVHLYWDVNDERVFEYLQDSLDDMEAFARSIAARQW